LEQFARDLLAGKLVQFLKSEPVPTENPDAVRVSIFKLKIIIIYDLIDCNLILRLLLLKILMK
jgi:hypothetical protein